MESINPVPNQPPARILIVDDEIAQMTALCETLRDHGYETVGYRRGQDALVALREKPCDVLLADLVMPEMDGISLCRAALEVDPNLAGIIMTGEGTIGTAVEAMKTGVLDYILKPFKLSVMLPVLARALSARRLRLKNVELERHIREHAAELETLNKELEAFSYSVSHDLRAPLRAIGAFSHILLEEHSAQLAAEGKNLLNRVVANTQRMEQLIEGLLRFSRLGRQPCAKRPVKMTVLVGEVVEELRKEQCDRDIEVRVSDLPDGIGDHSLLKQVFVNLLSNAFKYTRQRDHAFVDVSGRHHQGENVYSIRDNGVGFDMQYADKLFGVFQRLHRTEEFEGSGIGLSIAQRIIQRHGGRIWAEAHVGQGATFSFTLPGEASDKRDGPSERAA